MKSKSDRAKIFAWCSMLTILFLSATQGRQVPVTSGLATGTGSLSQAVGSAAAGDTVIFNIAGRDSVLVQSRIIRDSDIVFLGPNRATGNRPLVCFASTTGTSEILKINKGKTSIINVRLSGGSKVEKGGCLSGYGSGTRIEIDSAEVMNGLSYFKGGGIYINRATLLISNSTIADNQSKVALHSNTGVPPRSFSYGGGICNDSGQVIIINSTFSRNVAQASSTTANTFDNGSYPGITADAFGGALYNSNGAVTLINCTLFENSTSASCWSPISKYMWVSSGGGGIFSGGESGSLNLINCTISENSAFSSWDNYHNNSGWAHGSGLMNSGRKYLVINTIIVAHHRDFISGVSVKDDFCSGVTYPVRKMLNSTMSLFFGTPPVSTNVRSGVKPEQIFASDTPALAYNGGPTKTVALGHSSIALHAGLKAGYYAQDSMLVGTADSVLKPAWYNGTAWISIETDSQVPAAYTVVPLPYDQRGFTRENPPCIGAFETGDMVAVKRGYAGVTDCTSAEIRCIFEKKQLQVFSRAPGKANVALFDLKGRLIEKLNVSFIKGVRRIPLARLMEPGTYIYSVENAGSRSAGTMLVR